MSEKGYCTHTWGACSEGTQVYPAHMCGVEIVVPRSVVSDVFVISADEGVFINTESRQYPHYMRAVQKAHQGKHKCRYCGEEKAIQ